MRNGWFMRHSLKNSLRIYLLNALSNNTSFIKTLLSKTKPTDIMEHMNPIFIVGSHKSGTTLFKSLFDGHRDIFVIPFETELMKWIGNWIYYPLKRQFPKENSINDIKNALVSNIRHIDTMRLDKMGGLGNIDLRGRFNLGYFRKFMKKTHTSLNEMIIDYFIAIYYSLGGEIPFNKKYIVEKTVGNSEYAIFLKQLFPNAKFIHLIRNPYANIVSLRRYASKRLGHYPPLYPYMDGLDYTYHMLYKNELLLQEDYYVLKYEDLIEHPTETMQKIARYLNIDYTSTLTIPSTIGIQWVGNSSTGETFYGISKSPLAKWKKDILPMEIRWVNLRFSHILERFGYERLSSFQNILKKNKGESFKTYIVNRIAYRLDQIKYKFHPSNSNNQFKSNDEV